MSVSINAAGWTEIVPAPDARKIHVAANGNDSAGGTSPATARRTPAKGFELVRDGQGDQLLFCGTDTWSEPLGKFVKSGASAANPIVVGTYGVGRAKFRTPANVTPLSFTGGGGAPPKFQHVAFVGLDFEPVNRNGSEKIKGVEFLRPVEDVLFEDCSWRGFETSLVFMGVDGPLKNIRLRRSLMLDSRCTTGHSQGLYTDQGVSGLSFFECLFDDNGNNPSTIFNHNVYSQSGQDDTTTFDGCVISRGSATGLMLRSGGTVKACLLLHNPIAIILKKSGVLRGNVILNGRDIQGLAGGGRGWGIEIQDITKARVTDNLIAHKGSSTYPIAVQIQDPIGDMAMSGNVVCDWACGPLPQYPDNDWNRATQDCVDPSRNVPAGYMALLRLQNKTNWNKALWPYALNRHIKAGYAPK